MSLYLQKRIGVCLLLVCLPLINQQAIAVNVADYPALNELTDDLVSNHGFDKAELSAMFSGVVINQKIIKAIKRPSERLPWHKYRNLFVTSKNIANGVRFWRANEETLSRAAAKYGVPQHIIVAIIGVETRYGAVTGGHRVLESLTTLGLGYPRRSKFFLGELKEYLILAREEGLPLSNLKGSYAGAMGIPQFMPSSYRQYAVDFNGDHTRDLISQTADAIGSVANYLHVHKWRAGAPISARIGPVSNAKADSFVGDKLSTTTTIGDLHASGVEVQMITTSDQKVGVVRLDSGNGKEYRIGFHNFYVITRYNRSSLYAMAVNDLAEEIAREFGSS